MLLNHAACGMQAHAETLLSQLVQPHRQGSAAPTAQQQQQQQQTQQPSTCLCPRSCAESHPSYVGRAQKCWSPCCRGTCPSSAWTGPRERPHSPSCVGPWPPPPAAWTCPVAQLSAQLLLFSLWCPSSWASSTSSEADEYTCGLAGACQLNVRHLSSPVLISTQPYTPALLSGQIMHMATGQLCNSIGSSCHHYV